MTTLSLLRYHGVAKPSMEQPVKIEAVSLASFAIATQLIQHLRESGVLSDDKVVEILQSAERANQTTPFASVNRDAAILISELRKSFGL